MGKTMEIQTILINAAGSGADFEPRHRRYRYYGTHTTLLTRKVVRGG